MKMNTLKKVLLVTEVHAGRDWQRTRGKDSLTTREGFKEQLGIVCSSSCWTKWPMTLTLIQYGGYSISFPCNIQTGHKTAQFVFLSHNSVWILTILKLAKHMIHIKLQNLIIGKALKLCCMNSIRLLGVIGHYECSALQWRQVTCWRQDGEHGAWGRRPQKAERVSLYQEKHKYKYLYGQLYIICHCAQHVEYLSSILVLLVKETVREDVQESHTDEDVFTLNTRFMGSTVTAKGVEVARHGGLVHPRQDW